MEADDQITNTNFHLRSDFSISASRLGVCIETLNEPHKGPFSGTHARYVLRSTVTQVADAEVAA